MADEFKSFLEEFSSVGTNFAQNVKRVESDAEMQKVVEIYGSGLGAAMSGTAEVLRSHYQGLPPSKQAELDRMIGASGGTALLMAANTIMTSNFLGSLKALAAIPGIIEIAKKIIENFVTLPGGTGKLLFKIDLILDGLGKLFGFPKTLPDGEPQESTPNDQDEKRRYIRTCIDEIQAESGLSDARKVRAIGALRDILKKGEITEADFEHAKRICRETLGPGH